MPCKTKEEQREYQKKWVAKRRADFFSDKKCSKCNSTEKLELHHVDPKEKEHHAIWSWSEKRRLKEIAKCIVLCNRCHIEHHADQKSVKEDEDYHGRAVGYGKFKCRCNRCRQWNIDRQTRQRVKNLVVK